MVVRPRVLLYFFFFRSLRFGAGICLFCVHFYVLRAILFLFLVGTEPGVFEALVLRWARKGFCCFAQPLILCAFIILFALLYVHLLFYLRSVICVCVYVFCRDGVSDGFLSGP
jgi:hypothetical protein